MQQAARGPVSCVEEQPTISPLPPAAPPPPSPIKTYPFDVLMTLKFICILLFEGPRGRTLPILPPVKEALLMQKSKATTLDNACLDHHKAIALKCNAEGGQPFIHFE